MLYDASLKEFLESLKDNFKTFVQESDAAWWCETKLDDAIEETLKEYGTNQSSQKADV